MRVVFMGTPDFAVPTLRALARTHSVVGVYTRPDAVSGRGSASRPSPVKTVALELGIPVHQPRTLRDVAEQQALVALDSDLLVVAAYGLILPSEALDSARLGAVNVHASLLPRWRGAAPIERAILAGDESTGVSIMRMEAGLDTGPYCAQVSTRIADKNADALTSELADLGADALLGVLPAIADGTVEWTEQDEDRVTYAEKVAKSDVALGPALPAADVVARVRASSRSAPARARVAGRPLAVTQAQLADASEPAPGMVSVTRAGVFLGTSDGVVAILRLKPEGKADMAAADWARGVPAIDGSSWEALA